MTEQTTGRMGTMKREGDLVVLHFERRLAHPPEKVWRALTESEGLQHWFPADIVGERREGAEVRMPFWPRSVEHGAEEMEQAGVDLDDPVLPGRILTWEPPRVFELMWDSDRLLFELAPDGAGTRLDFTTWLPVGDEGPRGAQGTMAGYHVCLDSLEDTVSNGASGMPDREEIEALERQYAALVDGGPGTNQGPTDAP